MARRPLITRARVKIAAQAAENVLIAREISHTGRRSARGTLPNAAARTMAHTRRARAGAVLALAAALCLVHVATAGATPKEYADFCAACGGHSTTSVQCAGLWDVCAPADPTRGEFRPPFCADGLCARAAGASAPTDSGTCQAAITQMCACECQRRCRRRVHVLTLTPTSHPTPRYHRPAHCCGHREEAS